MDFRVALHVLWHGEHERYLTGVVDDRPVLVVPVNEEIAEELSTAYPLEAVPVTISDIGAICAEQGVSLIGLYGLEGEDELSVFSEETLPLFIEEA